MCSCEKVEIPKDILAYLVEHPEAQDTLEGIIEWWVLDQEIKRQSAEVKEAIDHLVSECLLIEKQGADSRIHYRANRRKMKRIKTMIKQRSR